MALPSVVTLGSLALVLASGAGYAVISTASAASAPASAPIHHVVTPPVTTHPTPTQPTKPSPKPHKTPKTDVVPHVLVVVFNNTGIAHLASQKASILRGAGWSVAATDNWYGNIPEDTVYYPPQLKADAAKLAKVLHITRLRPAVAPMQFDRLTVILASS